MCIFPNNTTILVVGKGLHSNAWKEHMLSYMERNELSMKMEFRFPMTDFKIKKPSWIIQVGTANHEDVLLLFSDRVSLGSSGWPRTCHTIPKERSIPQSPTPSPDS